MKYTNGWKYLHKEHDRFELKIRIGLLTVLDVFVDASDYRWHVALFNFKVGN